MSSRARSLVRTDQTASVGGGPADLRTPTRLDRLAAERGEIADLCGGSHVDPFSGANVSELVHDLIDRATTDRRNNAFARCR